MPYNEFTFFIGGQQKVYIDAQLFAKLTNPFATAIVTPESERKALQQAMVLFEKLVLPKAFVIDDIGGWRGNAMISCPDQRQQDCYDEQATVLPFLIALKVAGFLKFHDVVGEVENFDRSHAANALRQYDATGAVQKTWVLDTWVNNQGESPYLIPLDEWVQQGWHN